VLSELVANDFARLRKARDEVRKTRG